MILSFKWKFGGYPYNWFLFVDKYFAFPFQNSYSLIFVAIFDFWRSLNSWFGSGVMTKSGIILNNQLANFQVPDSSGGTLNTQVRTTQFSLHTRMKFILSSFISHADKIKKQKITTTFNIISCILFTTHVYISYIKFTKIKSVRASIL